MQQNIIYAVMCILYADPVTVIYHLIPNAIIEPPTLGLSLDP